MSNVYLNTAGKFRARVERPTGGWIQEIGIKCTPAVVLPLIIIGGPCENQRIEWNGYLSEAALSSTVKSLHEAFNFDGSFGALARDPMGFEGYDCNITVEVEEYKGKPQFKVKYLNKFVEPMAQDAVESFADSLDARARAVVADLKAKKDPITETDEINY